MTELRSPDDAPRRRPIFFNLRLWVSALVLSSVIPRVFLWRHYEVTTVADSGTYLSAARAYQNGALDDGGRTPAYPLLLLATGFSEQRVWVLQMAMGVGTSLLLFAAGYLLTGNAPIAFGLGISHSLNLQQIFFEAVVASETLATLLVTAASTALLFLVHRQHTKSRFSMLVAGAALAAAVATLARPQYAFLPVVVAFAVGWAAPGSVLRNRVTWALAGLAPGFVAVLGWSIHNRVRHDYFVLSTYMGINLTNHTIQFVESAPEGDREVASILARYRDDKVRRTGRHAMAVWEALPELRRETGLSQPQLSRALSALALNLILENPFGYASSVALAWKDFWMVPNYWQLDKWRAESFRAALEAAWWLEKWFLRALNASLILVIAFTCIRPRWACQRWSPSLALLAVIVLGSSVLQALVEYGENPRYGVTIQPLVVLFMAAFVVRCQRAPSTSSRPA